LESENLRKSRDYEDIDQRAVQRRGSMVNFDQRRAIMQVPTSAVLLCSLVIHTGAESQAATTTTLARPSIHQQGLAHHFYTYAIQLYSNKEDNAALQSYTKAIESDAKLTWGFYRRGNLLASRGEIKKAIADFKKATDLEPNLIFGHYNLACLYSVENNVPEALACLETALKMGYRKFDKLENDSDLDNIRHEQKYADLLSEYRRLAEKEKLSSVQSFQIEDADVRATIIQHRISAPDGESFELARLAVHDLVPEIRMLGMDLLTAIHSTAADEQLVIGLYDAHGGVCKAAASGLVARGKDSAKLVAPILEERDSPAVFYALQVIGQVGTKASADKIVPFLNDSRNDVRFVAARSLAQLDAVDSLPQLENALKVAQSAAADVALEIELKQAIEHLRAIRQTEGP
jgi:tetratricopeptide (TPR) repeat protein